MKDGLFRKGLVFGIIVLFIGASIIPIINGNVGRTYSFKTKINSSSMNCYAYSETWNKESNTILSQDKVNEIYNVFTELKNKIASDPISDETQALKTEFVDLLDENGLIPDGYSKDDYVSLLNPVWLTLIQNSESLNELNSMFNELKYAMIHDPLDINTQMLKTEFVNLLNENNLIPVGMQKSDFASMLNPSLFGVSQKTGKIGYVKDAPPVSIPSAAPYANSGTSIFCSVGSAGDGIVFPFILLPRPRIITIWQASNAATTIANIFTQEGFIAGGTQRGLSVGFMGIGLAFIFPGGNVYGFVGYSLLTTVNADSIEYYPPNSAPIISDENPSNGAENIPLSFSELSFRINDPDGDRMDYTVTTEPNIGSGSGNNKNAGVYTVPISGLETDKSYKWTVEVSDGKNVLEKKFYFIVERGPPFDPFNEGWKYCKKITVNHTQVAGNLINFPLLISIIDSDLRDKAQEDGDDILFMDDFGVANKLYHEIEAFDGSSGELVTWCKIYNLSSTEDNMLYMYYNNSGCNNQQNVFGTWDSSVYVGVWHLYDKTNTVVGDSTVNGYDGTKKSINQPNEINGKIGKAQQFNKVNYEYISMGDVSDLEFIGDFTISAWFNPSTTNGGKICGKHSDQSGQYTGYDLNWNIEDTKPSFRCDGGGYNYEYTWANTPLPPQNWYYIVGSKMSGINYLYINGLQQADTGHQSLLNTDNCFALGTSNNGAYGPFNGTIDEVRALKVGRTESWSLTEYNNQNDPSSFVSIGSEESSP